MGNFKVPGSEQVSDPNHPGIASLQSSQVKGILNIPYGPLE